MQLFRPALLALILCGLGASAPAHDTWFQPLREGPAGAVLTLGTGNRYPVQEFPIGHEQLRARGCRAADGAPLALEPVLLQRQALVMRSGAPPAGQAVTCWAEVMAFEIDLSPELVAVYLDEVRAGSALRQAWAAQQAAGHAWRERYTKHARLELPGQAADQAAPVPLALDLLLHAPRPLRANSAARLQLRLEGRPLPDQPLELVAADGRSAQWLQTDAQGEATMDLPPAGLWLLRGTWLQPPPQAGGRWHSRFVTLAFEIR